MQHRVDRKRLGQARRHQQQPLESAAIAVRTGALLRALECQSHVLGQRHQHLQLRVGGTQPRHGLVHRKDPQQVPVVSGQRHEQRILGVPGVGIIADRDVRGDRQHVVLPVVLPSGYEVDAAALEPVIQQRRPRVPAAAGAEQLLDRLLVVVAHRGHLEVIPGRPVEVDHDRLVAERVGDGAGDRVQHLGQRLVIAHHAGNVQEAAQPCQSVEIVGGHCARVRGGSSTVCRVDAAPS